MSDRELQLLVACLGVVAWIYVLTIRHITRVHDGVPRWVIAFGVILSIGFLAVSMLVVHGSSLTILFASFNRGFVAAVGLVIGINTTRMVLHRRRRSRERR